MTPEQIKASLDFLKRQMKGTPKPRVLVVEDDADDLYMLVRQLSRFSVEVVVADNAEDAKRLIKENGISIVLLDLSLPLVPGVEVIKANRGLDPKLHFVVVTGSKDLASVDEALKAGAVLVLDKPVSHETLARFLEPKA